MSDTDGNTLYYYPVTTKYGDIASDPDYAYQTGGELYASGQHANFRGDKKAWVKVTVTQGHAYDADIYWEVHYKKLEDSGWTDIGDFKGSASTKTTEIYLPVDGSSKEPESNVMFFKLVGVTNNTAKTPILSNFDVRALWYPSVKTFIKMQVKCEDNLVTKDGLTDETQTEADIRGAFDGLKNPSTAWPVAFEPPYYKSSSDVKYVKVLPPSEYRINSLTRDVERYEGVYEILLLVVEGLSF